MNMELNDPIKVKKVKQLIYALSIVIPIAVAALFSIKIEGVDFTFLPPIYAFINGITAVSLIGALVAIKSKDMKLHRRLIRLSLLLSVLFLLCYVAYHITSDPTPYLGSVPYIYYPLLIAHIVLSVVVIPLVLLTYLQAWTGQYDKHKKWAKISWPIWVFVAISGVVVYLMIAPYY